MVSFFARWRSFAEKIGNFQARFILTMLYFTVFVLASLIAIAKDSLKLRIRRNCWLDRNEKNGYESIEELKRQW